MLENINLALQGVWSHKLRSFLTMLGIIIGIAAIITIVSTIRGTNEQIKQNLIGAGNDMVQVQLTQDGSVVDLSYGEIPEGIATITSAMRDEMDALPGVSAVAMYHQRTWADGIYAGNNSFTGTLNGVDDHYLSVAGYQVNYGRAFLPEDFSSCRKVAVIDTAAAQSLFPGQNPIGGVIEMQGEPFTVVGVVSQRVTSQPVINSVEDYQMYARTTSGTVMIPESCWPIAFRYDEPMNVAVRASSTKSRQRRGGLPQRKGRERQQGGLSGAGSAEAGLRAAKPVGDHQPPADLDRRHLSGGGRHRRHEHHAGFRHRAHP